MDDLRLCFHSFTLSFYRFSNYGSVPLKQTFRRASIFSGTPSIDLYEWLLCLKFLFVFAVVSTSVGVFMTYDYFRSFFSYEGAGVSLYLAVVSFALQTVSAVISGMKLWTSRIGASSSKKGSRYVQMSEVDGQKQSTRQETLDEQHLVTN